MLLTLLLPVLLFGANLATSSPVAGHGKTDLSGVCGKFNEERIVGGHASAEGAWPWTAAITIHDAHGPPRFCGGVLVAAEWVMSTAHCIYEIGSSGSDSFDVVLGTNDISDMNAPGRIDITSEYGFPHPDWSDSYWTENDVGFIQLPHPVNFTDSVRPVCLPTQSDVSNSYDGATATAVGWGKLHETDEAHSDILYEVELQVTSNILCQVDYGPMIGDGHLCVDTWFGSKGICGGDAGSPLHYKDGDCWKLIGIAQFINKGMCEDGKPHGFQRVTHYLDWISEVTGVLIH